MLQENKITHFFVMHTSVPQMGPVAPLDDFLKSHAEIEAEFTYHAYSTDTKNISPEADVTRKCKWLQDPIRLYMELEDHSMEQNY